MFLVDLLRPEVIVELGTQYGDSYCAFCHSVQELNLTAHCYAIDNWQGDPHVGSYGPEILADLRAHHDSMYGSFSRLIQGSFDDALQHFPDGSIDLLHIDGYHVYEVVRTDFEYWLPKTSERGVILFHDTNVRERDFGVWKLWQELREQYLHFEFLHGSGLGMLVVGKDFPIEFQEFLETSLNDTATIRRFFFQLGQRLTLEVQQRTHQQVLTEKENQLTRLAQETTQLQSTVQGQQHALSEKDQRLAYLTTERQRVKQEAARLRDTILAHQKRLAEKEEQLKQLAAEREQSGQEVVELQEKLASQREILARQEEELNSAVLKREHLGRQLAQLRVTLEQKLQELTEQETALLRIYQSHGWKALALYYRVRNGVFPEGTRRRVFAKKIFHAAVSMSKRRSVRKSIS